jgi:hypothetical protein
MLRGVRSYYVPVLASYKADRPGVCAGLSVVSCTIVNDLSRVAGLRKLGNL